MVDDGCQGRLTGQCAVARETFVQDSQYMDHDQIFTLSSTFNKSQMQACGWPPWRSAPADERDAEKRSLRWWDAP